MSNPSRFEANVMTGFRVEIHRVTGPVQEVGLFVSRSEARAWLKEMGYEVGGRIIRVRIVKVQSESRERTGL